MFRMTSFSLVFLALLATIPFTLSNWHPISAQQPSRPDKEENPPYLRSLEQYEKDEIKALEEAFPALYKVRAPTGKDDQLYKLLHERFYAALQEVRRRKQDWAVGVTVPRIRGNLEFLAEAHQNLLNSRLELVEKPEEELVIREDFVKAIKEFEKMVRGQLNNGKTDAASFDRAHYVRVDAEVQLLKAKRRLEK